MEALLHKGPMLIGEIGSKVLLSSGSMTAAIDRLEGQGLVRRVPDPADKRRIRIHLTPAGRRLIVRAFARHAETLDQVASVLTPTERGELVRLLKKLGRHAAKLSNALNG
jgi:MarR family 2-MHQ and catechol resistance regulon transcriptional repressor